MLSEEVLNRLNSSTGAPGYSEADPVRGKAAGGHLRGGRPRDPRRRVAAHATGLRRRLRGFRNIQGMVARWL